jgi:hypothetical protein
MSQPGLRFQSSRLGILLLPVLLAGCSDARWLSKGAAKIGGITVQGPHAIVCWGDSMTQGNEGVINAGIYPGILQTSIGPQVVNEGIGGQTSTQIGVRQGGVPTPVTVAGGVIPANGGVTVKFATGYEPLTDPYITIQGSIDGVVGNLALSAVLPGGVFTFTPIAGSRTPVTVIGTPRFVPETPYQTFLPIFWEGRNNLFATAKGPYGPAQIESDIAAQVASLPKSLNYLVLSLLNQNDPNERSGGVGYATVMSLDNTLSATYGTHYLDVRSLLVNSYDSASPVDVSDYNSDMIPTSLGATTAQGTLVSRIGKTDTTFTVKLSAGSLTGYNNLVIDNESIHILTVSGSTVTSCTRGYGGTLASHSAGAAVTQRDPTHLNSQGYTIVANAVAKKLGL